MAPKSSCSSMRISVLALVSWYEGCYWILDASETGDLFYPTIWRRQYIRATFNFVNLLNLLNQPNFLKGFDFFLFLVFFQVA